MHVDQGGHLLGLFVVLDLSGTKLEYPAKSLRILTVFSTRELADDLSCCQRWKFIRDQVLWAPIEKWVDGLSEVSKIGAAVLTPFGKVSRLGP